MKERESFLARCRLSRRVKLSGIIAECDGREAYSIRPLKSAVKAFSWITESLLDSHEVVGAPLKCGN